MVACPSGFESAPKKRMAGGIPQHLFAEHVHSMSGARSRFPSQVQSQRLVPSADVLLRVEDNLSEILCSLTSALRKLSPEMLPVGTAEAEVTVSDISKDGQPRFAAHDARTQKLIGVYSTREAATSAEVIAWYKRKEPLFSPSRAHPQGSMNDLKEFVLQVKDLATIVTEETPSSLLVS